MRSTAPPAQRRLRLAQATRLSTAPAVPRAEPRAAPSTGTAEFDGGVGVAAFRPPAPAARAKAALGRPGVATFDKGTGKAAFSASPTSSSLVATLKRYGLAGVLSYGVLNTLWYTGAFLTAASVAGAPAGGGWNAAAAKAAKVLAMTWAGSQVTKAARLAAAVLFAPLADRLIDAVRTSLRLRSKKAAFAVCVLTLCALASGVLVGKTLTWV